MNKIKIIDGAVVVQGIEDPILKPEDKQPINVITEDDGLITIKAVEEKNEEEVTAIILNKKQKRILKEKLKIFNSKKAIYKDDILWYDGWFAGFAEGINLNVKSEDLLKELKKLVK